MRKILFMCLFLLAVVPVFAQKSSKPARKIKKIEMSAEEMRLRHELKNDKTVLQLTCGLFENIDPQGQYAQTRLQAQNENSRIRRLLYEASQTNDKTAKAKYSCSEVGDETIEYFLVVDQGKVMYMGDYSQDKSGNLRLNTGRCDKLNIGTMAPTETTQALVFTPLNGKNYDGKVLILQCQAGSKSFIF